MLLNWAQKYTYDVLSQTSNVKFTLRYTVTNKVTQTQHFIVSKYIKVVLSNRTFDVRPSRTFVHYTFSPLFPLLYAEFGLSYTADEQTLRAVAQWRCKTESQTLFCVYWIPERPVLVAAQNKAWVCDHSLAVIAGSNPAGGMDVFFFWLFCVVR